MIFLKCFMKISFSIACLNNQIMRTDYSINRVTLQKLEQKEWDDGEKKES